jgi:hypothetical protein
LQLVDTVEGAVDNLSSIAIGTERIAESLDSVIGDWGPYSSKQAVRINDGRD